MGLNADTKFGNALGRPLSTDAQLRQRFFLSTTMLATNRKLEASGDFGFGATATDVLDGFGASTATQQQPRPLIIMQPGGGQSATTWTRHE